MTASSPTGRASGHPAAVPGGAASARDWVELGKPRITLLLLVTCMAGTALAAAGSATVTALTVLATALGFTLSSAGASACNHVLDRGIDARMPRTRLRPVARGAISPRAAWAYGIALLLLGAGVLWAGATPLAAVLSTAGGVFYVAGYGLLKRTTIHNTVLGGIAGAVPPLVGWAAVTGSVADPMPWALFALMFCWQPPHFWALSLLIRRDYAGAGVPMLPVVKGELATVRATWRWTWIALASSALPLLAGAGVVYAAGAAAAGVFLLLRMRDLRTAVLAAADAPDALDGRGTQRGLVRPGTVAHRAARDGFLGSMLWLAACVLALVFDAALPL